MNDNTMILFGGEVKAKEVNAKEWIAEGPLVLFSTKSDPDASQMQDFFTADTDYDLEFIKQSRVYYQHGLDSVFGLKKLAIADLEMTDAEIWARAQMKIRDEYDEQMFEMGRKGLFGWSSGVPRHLVKREKQDNGAHKVLYWPLGLDASLTPNPAEPRTFVNVKSLFSIAEERIEVSKFDLKCLDDIASERDYEDRLRPYVGGEAATALVAIAKHNFKSKSLRNREEEEAARVVEAEDKAREERIRDLHRRQKALSLWQREQGLHP